MSDYRICYISARFVKFFIKNSIKHVAVNILRINDQVERFNHSIIPMLAKLLNDIRKWSSRLDEICIE